MHTLPLCLSIVGPHSRLILVHVWDLGLCTGFIHGLNLTFLSAFDLMMFAASRF